ncbi:hypothetical protein XELAEV_18000615mg [Xenopus laevis]|nr:hypothetical protein XELAEV_18000615mg [Xenopus laevis]
MGCNCCSSIIKGNTVNHPTRVYLLKCPCGMGYVGQTKREIKIHIQEHRDEAALDKRGGNRLKKLLQLEGKWIKKLNTLTPDGMNDSWSLKPYL